MRPFSCTGRANGEQKRRMRFRPHHNLTQRRGGERKGRMKRLIAMAIIAVTAIEFVSAAPKVTDITAKQRYPWNGLVDISCKVSGIEAETGGYEFAVVAVDKETGKEYTVSNFSVKHSGEDVTGLDVYENGDYSLLWNAREDMGQVVIERMAVRITLEALAVSVGKVQLWEGGPYWADRNIGAKKPEDSGLYFWWGDTKGHRPAADGTFSFKFSSANSAIYTYGKSESELQSAGWVTSDGVLAPAHDAAHVKWGGAWRMPTYQELYALWFNKCDWTWTTMNGVNGYVVRGRGSYASNSIFLPAAGRGSLTSLSSAGSGGYYYQSVPFASMGYYGMFYGSHNFTFNSRYRNVTEGGGRTHGLPIRPVQ